ncbi:hypothetical protein yc1106_01334 [Curvularia clavata]|uniref:2EXR domain-containing protein n=1 Tax=Curvularia clavata TaxID=95742 RepID=A0A9Q8Z2P2_CURCL|nr:hypothetical protein yc1106_01334 [Curvularia clavata]
MTAFHPFPRLPLELREQIWKDTVEPRTVEVRCVQEWPHRYDQQPMSSTPIPAVLQSCREARNLGLYERVFFEVAVRPKFKGNFVPVIAFEDFFFPDDQEDEIDPPITEQRYVWLNFDIDMVDIKDSEFRNYHHIASAIKRLKFEWESSCASFCYSGLKELKPFVNVEEIHVVCTAGFSVWAWATCEYSWPCNEEKLLFIDASNGRVARGTEFEAICRPMTYWRTLD